MNDLNMEAVKEKVCSRCKEAKEATTDNFPANKTSKDGLSHWCKACHSKYRKNKSLKSRIERAMDPTEE
jgi:hypothetical protein